VGGADERGILGWTTDAGADFAATGPRWKDTVKSVGMDGLCNRFDWTGESGPNLERQLQAGFAPGETGPACND